MMVLALLVGCGEPPVAGSTMSGGPSGLEERVAKLEAEVVELRGRLVNKRESEEKEVLGKDAILQAEEWIQGEVTLADGKATLLVSWEEWCPHCKREVPKLQATYEKLHDQGLNVVGVTRMNRGADRAKVDKFIAANKLTYPMLKDDGTMGKHYAVSGVPAVALVKGGKVVWRGNPAKLHENMLLASLQ
jgi:thiol-disulfide isomerase/thioredoxin